MKDKVNRCLARYSPRATTTSQPINRAPNGWILIFPTSRLPPRWAILRWGILISRYINIAHPGYNTIFLSCMPLSRIQNSPNSIFDLVFHFWDQWVVLFFHFCKWSCFTFLAVKWMQNNCHTFCRMVMCRSKWRTLLQLGLQCTPTRFYNFFQVHC